MYIYKNIVCLYNNEQTDDQNTDYKNFINTYIPNYTFDTSFPNNQTIFVLSNNVITGVFKLDMYLNIICVTNVYVNNDYYRTVDDANKTYQQITDVIITNIVSTLQSSKLTYDIANTIKFKVYLYVNYDLDKSLYNKTKRTNCLQTVLGGHIPHICNEFVRFLHFNDQFIAKNVTLHKSSETQTDKQQKTQSQQPTTNFGSTFSQPTNFGSTFSQPTTTNFGSTFSQPTQPTNTNFGSTQPTNTFSSNFGKDSNKQGEKGNAFSGFTPQANQFSAFTTPGSNNMFSGVFSKDNKFGTHR